jgi:hypothetical protein
MESPLSPGPNPASRGSASGLSGTCDWSATSTSGGSGPIVVALPAAGTRHAPTALPLAPRGSKSLAATCGSTRSRARRRPHLRQATGVSPPDHASRDGDDRTGPHGEERSVAPEPVFEVVVTADGEGTLVVRHGHHPRSSRRSRRVGSWAAQRLCLGVPAGTGIARAA